MEENLNFDKVWALFQEDREQMKEMREQAAKDREQMNEARERDREQIKEAHERDREQIKEAHERDIEQMRKISEQIKANSEQIKANSEQIKANSEQIKANSEQIKATTEQMKETDRKFQETDKQFKQMRIETKELSLNLGGIGNSNGECAENYFYNSLNHKKMFGNEHFDRIDFNVKPPLSTDGRQDEYDIVLLNGKSVAIIEVKYRAKKEHVAKTINKATTFRQFFPVYKDCIFYIGLAGFSFEEGAEQEALNAGLAVLKQVGDNVVVYDERIKKF